MNPMNRQSNHQEKSSKQSVENQFVLCSTGREPPQSDHGSERHSHPSENPFILRPRQTTKSSIKPKDFLLGLLLILTLIFATVLLFMILPIIFQALPSIFRASESPSQKNSSNSLDFLKHNNLLFENNTLNFSAITFDQHRTIIDLEIEKTKNLESNETTKKYIASFSSLREYSVNAEKSLNSFYKSLAYKKAINIELIDIQTIHILLTDFSLECHFLFFDFLINTVAFFEMNPPQNINYQTVIPTFDKIKNNIAFHNRVLNLKLTYMDFLENVFLNSLFNGQKISIDFTYGGPNKTLAITTFSRTLFSQLILSEMKGNSVRQFRKFLSRKELKNAQYLLEIENFLTENSNLENKFKNVITQYLSENKPIYWSNSHTWISIFFIFWCGGLFTLLYKQSKMLDASDKDFYLSAKTALEMQLDQKNVFCDSNITKFIEEIAHLKAQEHSIRLDNLFFPNQSISKREASFKTEINKLLKSHKKSEFTSITKETLKPLEKFINLNLIDKLFKINIKGCGVHFEKNNIFFIRTSLFHMILDFFLTAISSYDKNNLTVTLKKNSFIRKKSIDTLHKKLLDTGNNLLKKGPIIKSKFEFIQTNTNFSSKQIELMKNKQKETKKYLDTQSNKLKKLTKNSNIIFLPTEKYKIKKENLEKLTKLEETIQTIKNKNNELMGKLEYDEYINNLHIEIEAIQKILSPLHSHISEERINTLLNAQKHLDTLKILEEKTNQLNKFIKTCQAVSTDLDEQVKQLKLEVQFISCELETAEAIIQADHPEEDDGLEPNNEKIKVEVPKISTPALNQEKKQEIVNDQKKPDEIKFEEEKLEEKFNEVKYENPEYWHVLPPKQDRLSENFNNIKISTEKRHYKKKNRITPIEQKSGKPILHEQEALVNQYIERLHAFLVIDPKKISTPMGCLPAAIVYQNFKFFHAFDVLIKQHQDKKLSTDHLNIFKNDSYLRQANKIRNLLRHPAEHGFSTNFFNNPEKIKALIESLRGLIAFENHFKITKKLKNIPLNNSDKITLNFEELLDCQPLDFQFENIIQPDINSIAKENVNYALNMLVSIHTYIYNNPEKKDILLEEDHYIPACIKMMMLLIRDGLKNLNNDEKYSKFSNLLRKNKVQQTTFNVLTDFLAHDAAASEQTPTFLTKDGELDTLVEDISRGHILDILQSAKTYLSCFNQAFNGQNNNRFVRMREANNNNNQDVTREDQPIPHINIILSASSYKPNKSNLEKDDKKESNDFRNETTQTHFI